MPPLRTASALERFGLAWGTAFQLADDLAGLPMVAVTARADVRAT
ncbi:hypothetical protein [Streptomyces roseolus]